jgi:hypothetical protein
METRYFEKTAMPDVILHLSPETEQKLRDDASENGQSLEGYLEQLVEQYAKNRNGTAQAQAPQSALSDEEFERLLDQLSEGATLPHLPADFSRSDLYADHD